jgi:hypothetical protein
MKEAKVKEQAVIVNTQERKIAKLNCLLAKGD